MFSDFVMDFTSAEYENRILIIDCEGFEEKMQFGTDFSMRGFTVIHYKDDLSFRIENDKVLNDESKSLLVIAGTDCYIPYDVYKRFRTFKLLFETLFPKLNAITLREQRSLNLDLLCVAYRKNFDDFSSSRQTEDFLRHTVYDGANVEVYLQKMYSRLIESLSSATNYSDWIKIAERKASLDVMAAKYQIIIETSQINIEFKKYILKKYGGLSSELSQDSPVMVSRAMEYMHDHSDKFVIVVMDGMSEFDWEIISDSFDGIPYERAGMYAMIPSTTAISRQCLLSNKYPIKLMEPWKQSKEKQEFENCARELGYLKNQIAYERGYDAVFNSLVCCGAVIINDVDNMVHAQKQGRIGMYNDVSFLSKEGKLSQMVKRFMADGFDVYITADHGNTNCIGVGKLTGTGVEVETRSHRMVVLQNFANKDLLIEKYKLIEYPKYYLDKGFDYLICDVGASLDTKGEYVMTHGGITLDEVIVPFIKIKAVKANA